MIQQQIKSSPEAPLTVKDLKSESENTDKTKGRRQEGHIAGINQQRIKSSPEAPLTVQVSLKSESENTDKTKGAAASVRQEERCQN